MQETYLRLAKTYYELMDFHWAAETASWEALLMWASTKDTSK